MKQKLSKRTRKTIINIVVLVVLVGATIGILLATQGTDELNFENIGSFLADCKPWYIVAAVACMLASILFEGLALFVIARRLGHKSKFHSSLAYGTADIYYSALTPSASGGQPASLYYMCRDGMSGGIAGFTLVLNLLAYSAAIVIMGVFAFIMRPGIFSGTTNAFAQTLIIIGFVMHILLLGFVMVCILWSKALLKIGNGIIKLGTKMKIVKKPDKWLARWSGVVDKYRSSRDIIKSHPILFFVSLILNLAQRVSYVLIPCLLCLGTNNISTVLEADVAAPSILDLFCMQTFVWLGYNSVPLPGGTGGFEFMYLNVYGEFYKKSFVLSAMMVSRSLSYYLRFILCGVYTLIYHGVGLRKKRKDKSEQKKPIVTDDTPEWLKDEIAEAVKDMADDDDEMVVVKAADGGETATATENANGDEAVTAEQSAISDPPDTEQSEAVGAEGPETKVAEQITEEETVDNERE